MSAPRYIIMFASLALACSAIAQGTYNIPAPIASSAAPADSTQADPPARVARLAYLHGDVSFAPAGENDWVEAQLNRPVVTGDRVWTEGNGLAELEIGASTIRIGGQSSFDFLNLTDQTAQVELTQGMVNVDVRRTRGGETYEVDTPTLAFVADRVGNYRIDVDAQANTTTVSVRRGGGEIYGEGGARVSIGEGQALSFNNAQLRNYQTSRVQRNDAFDSFAAERNQRYERLQSRNYVSEDVVGYADLDDYGSWSDAPEYGHVWYPSSVAADWAPYHQGHWGWIDPWGWTWVDDAPWGFAPFHYGRWVNVESRWGWVPGPVDVRPVYAPALVAFVGGGGFGIDISLGGPIGWFPLGPRDVYFPGYRCGRNYFTSINISNARISNDTVRNYYVGFARGNIDYSRLNYANRNRPGAIAAVPARAFASGRPVAASSVALNRSALTNARIMPRAALVPTRASVLAANGRAPRAAPPASVLNRAVVAARTPPAAPASFAARQHLLQRTPGQPLNTTQLRALAAQQPQRGAGVRNAMNARVVANAGRGTERNAVSTTQKHSTIQAPAPALSASARHNERAAAVATERHAVPVTNRAAHVRSSSYAHAQPDRRKNAAVSTRTQTLSAPRGGAGSAHAPGQNRSVAGANGKSSTQHLRSSEMTRSRAPQARPENRIAAMPHQHQPAPQYQRSTSHGAAPRAEKRIATTPQRVVPAPGHQGSIERTPPARTPLRAESRAAPSHINPAPAAQPRTMPQQQRYARQNYARQPANAKKDKNDNGRN